MKVQGKTKLWEHWYWCLYYLAIYCLPTRLSKVQMMQKLAVFVSHLKGSLKSTYTRTQGTSWTVEITVICFHVNRKDTKCFWISILYCRSAGCFSHRQEDFSVSRVFSSSHKMSMNFVWDTPLLYLFISWHLHASYETKNIFLHKTKHQSWKIPCRRRVQFPLHLFSVPHQLLHIHLFFR